MQRFLPLVGTIGLTTLLAIPVAAQNHTVSVVASDYSFAAPDTIPAGFVTFRFTNTGKELHHAEIVRLEDGKTPADFAAALKAGGPPPSWVVFLGGPNAPVPDGKSESDVAVDLQPGNYMFLCLMPSPDGTPHVMKGMERAFRVVAPTGATQAGTTTAPKADVTIKLFDYNFDIDKPIKAGTHVIEFRNVATQFHEAFIAKLPPHTSPTALMEWLKDGMKGRAPVIPIGGVVGIGPNKENFLTVTLAPGDYALYCFLPDATDGKEHVQHGMFKQITVQ